MPSNRLGTRSTRQAACDPCRRAKVSCDHKRPTCARCEETSRTRLCVYRSSPFKKNKKSVHDRGHGDHLAQRSLRLERSLGPPSEIARLNHGLSEDLTPRQVYPNPGHLGISSHAPIFDQIATSRDCETDQLAKPGNVRDPSASRRHEKAASEVAESLQQLSAHYSIDSLNDLITFWLAKGVSLSLAEPLLHPCINTVLTWPDLWTLQTQEHFLSLVIRLLNNSAQTLHITAESTLITFTGQLCGHQSRLETLGLFLAAVARATVDVPFFPPVYSTEDSRFKLQSIVTRLNDRIIDLCLSLDSLNDLQLILQFEHFVVHSNVSGDQSEFQGEADSTCTDSAPRPTLLALPRRCNSVSICFGLSRGYLQQEGLATISREIERERFGSTVHQRQELRDFPW